MTTHLILNKKFLQKKNILILKIKLFISIKSVFNGTNYYLFMMKLFSVANIHYTTSHKKIDSTCESCI